MGHVDHSSLVVRGKARLLKGGRSFALIARLFKGRGLFALIIQGGGGDFIMIIMNMDIYF